VTAEAELQDLENADPLAAVVVRVTQVVTRSASKNEDPSVAGAN
jgi:hypothetical protein